MTFKVEQEIRLAGNLKRIMATKGLRLTTVARKTGMRKSTLHGYLNGVIPRNLQQLKALADFLNVSFADLIFGEETAKTESIEGRYEVIIRRVPETLKTVK